MVSIAGRTGFKAFLVTAFIVANAVPAFAWSRHHDRVYADSFGNLVVDSAAGYKRIIVGQGGLAKELSDYVAAGEAGTGAPRRMSNAAVGNDCYRPPVFVRGRSHMYGLADGEMPELSPCR